MCFLDLREDFDNAALVNTTSLIPKEAGSIENFEFKPEHFKIENGTKFYIAIQAIHGANLTSEVSNIAQATKFIPPQESSAPCSGYQDFCNQFGNLGISYDFIYFKLGNILEIIFKKERIFNLYILD